MRNNPTAAFTTSSGRQVAKSKSNAAKNLLHHARYYKKDVDSKEVRDLKNQALLRKARNSNGLKVTPMNDVKSFDKHI